MSTDFDTIWDHLGALRETLLRCFFIILTGTVLSFFFCQEILHYLTLPLQKIDAFERYEVKRIKINNSTDQIQEYLSPQEEILSNIEMTEVETIGEGRYRILPGGSLQFDKSIPENRLIMLEPIEGILIGCKVSLISGLLMTCPLWLACLLQFVLPGLYSHERKLIFIFILLSFLFIFIGFAFAYKFIIPIANQYLFSFNSSIGQNFWSLSSYINYTIFLLTSNALAFEAALFLLVLVHMGTVSKQALQEKRRHMIVGAFIIGAIFTPPDILTQFMLAIPLICLYELAILYAHLRTRVKKGELCLRM